MASGQFHSTATASVTAPDLVYINPDVQVIADYDEPIFFNSNYYWRNDGAVWYRSTNYTSGWVRVDAAPPVILRIDRPRAYIHYHGQVEAAASSSAAARHDEPKQERKEERKDDRKDDRDDHKDKAPKRH
jgi:hypothetical protein